MFTSSTYVAIALLIDFCACHFTVPVIDCLGDMQLFQRLFPVTVAITTVCLSPCDEYMQVEVLQTQFCMCKTAPLL